MTVSFALPQFVVPIHLALITSLNIVSPNVQNAKPAYIGDIIKQSRSKLTTPYIIFNKQYTKRVCHCPNILLQDMFSSHTIFRIITAVLIKTHKVECVVEENEYA